MKIKLNNKTIDIPEGKTILQGAGQPTKDGLKTMLMIAGNRCL